MKDPNSTVVVFYAPEHPLVCIREGDLPVRLEVGQVYQFDALFLQQTHKPLVGIGRSHEGKKLDANNMLKGILNLVFGEDQMMSIYARGARNYSAENCIDVRTLPSGLVLDSEHILKATELEDVLFVTARVVSPDFIAESLTGKIPRKAGEYITVGPSAAKAGTAAKEKGANAKKDGTEGDGTKVQE